MAEFFSFFFRRLLSAVLNVFNRFRFYKAIKNKEVSKLMICQRLTEAIRVKYGPHVSNNIVLSHIHIMLKSEETVATIPELIIDDPAIQIVLRAMEKQEEMADGGKNYVAIYCGAFLSAAEELFDSGFNIEEIIQCFQLALEKSLQVLCVEKAKTSSNNNNNDNKKERKCFPSFHNKSNSYDASPSKLKIFSATREPENDEKTGNTVVNVLMYASPIGIAGYQPFGIEIEFVNKNDDDEDNDNDDNISLLLFEQQVAQLRCEFYIFEEIKANVIITFGNFDGPALSLMRKYNIMGVSVQNKFDLYRLSRNISGNEIMKSLVDCCPTEVQKAQSVFVHEFHNNRLAVIKGCGNKKGCGIIVVEDSSKCQNDDSNLSHLKEYEKIDGFVPGGGAVELQIAKELLLYSNKCPRYYKLGIQKFASALEVVPKTFGEFLGQNPDDLIEVLYDRHRNGNKSFGVCPPKDKFIVNPSNNNLILDLDLKLEDCIGDMTEKNILESKFTKFWALKNAVNAVSDILKKDFLTKKYSV